MGPVLQRKLSSRHGEERERFTRALVPDLPHESQPNWRRHMRRHLAVGTAIFVTAAFVLATNVHVPMAYAAGAYGKGAGFAKQTFKDNRKKTGQKGAKGDAAKPVGP